LRGSTEKETPLSLADTLTIKDAHGQPAMSAGFVAINTDGTMRLMANATADRAEVIRYGIQGGQPVAIGPTFLDRLQANALWLVLIPVFMLTTRLLKSAHELLKIPEVAK